MALQTASDYIYMALRFCGMLRPGAQSNSDLMADGLTAWAMLVDSWAAEREMASSVPQLEFGSITKPGSQQNGNGFLIGPVYSFTGGTTLNSPVVTCQPADTFNVSVGEAISGTGIPAGATVASFVLGGSSITISVNATATASVTVTATPDLVTARRPDSIIHANCVLFNTGTQPVYIPLQPLTPEQWAAQAIRQIPAINVTNLFYYDPQYPNGVFNCFPPLINNGLEIFTWGALGPPATAASPFFAPPGYQDALVKNLAARLWPLCTNQIAVNRVSQAYIEGSAYEAAQKVRLVNRTIPKGTNDFGGQGGQPDGYYDAYPSWSGLPT
jgi:hypothetical protein